MEGIARAIGDIARGADDLGKGLKYIDDARSIIKVSDVSGVDGILKDGTLKILDDLDNIRVVDGGDIHGYNKILERDINVSQEMRDIKIGKLDDLFDALSRDSTVRIEPEMKVELKKLIDKTFVDGDLNKISTRQSEFRSAMTPEYYDLPTDKDILTRRYETDPKFKKMVDNITEDVNETVKKNGGKLKSMFFKIAIPGALIFGSLFLLVDNIANLEAGCQKIYKDGINQSKACKSVFASCKYPEVKDDNMCTTYASAISSDTCDNYPDTGEKSSCRACDENAKVGSHQYLDPKTKENSTDVYQCRLKPSFGEVISHITTAIPEKVIGSIESIYDILFSIAKYGLTFLFGMIFVVMIYKVYVFLTASSSQDDGYQQLIETPTTPNKTPMNDDGGKKTSLFINNSAINKQMKKNEQPPIEITRSAFQQNQKLNNNDINKNNFYYREPLYLKQYERKLDWPQSDQFHINTFG